MDRIIALEKLWRKRRLDEVLVITEANVLSLTGVRCDNAVVVLGSSRVFYTDFRYAAAVRRTLTGFKVRDIKKLSLWGRRIGFESDIRKARYDQLVKLAPRGAKFVDVTNDIANLRAVKNEDELKRLKAAEKLNCEIWEYAAGVFKAGMTEREMARIIQREMVMRGNGEAFATIVSVGKNAAECHHEPDDTVWNGREPVLVDMGVKLDGVCSDLTRNILPRRMSPAYRRAYELVLEAHDAAIAAAKPGMTAAQLDNVARSIIRKGGFGKCFGHSLGHGVGYEIHEAPAISRRNRDTILKPGMVVTIEPGIYLEDNLGVRIEDMIVITDNGCEVISSRR